MGKTPQTETAGLDSPLPQDTLLRRYFSSEAERRERTREMFDAGASGYDRAEWLTGFGMGSYYRRQALQRLGLKPGESVLDVAIGTGLVAREAIKLIEPDGQLIGLDPSEGMLAMTKAKLNIETIRGYAESIPLKGDRFDAVTMGYALRHVSSMEAAFREYMRVLKPGGRVCIMEISRPQNKLVRLLVGTYIRRIVPLLARLVGERKTVSVLWEYYWDTIQICVDPEVILTAMRDAGFEAVRCDTTMGMFREYLGRKPETPTRAADDKDHGDKDHKDREPNLKDREPNLKDHEPNLKDHEPNLI